MINIFRYGRDLFILSFVSFIPSSYLVVTKAGQKKTSACICSVIFQLRHKQHHVLPTISKLSVSTLLDNHYVEFITGYCSRNEQSRSWMFGSFRLRGSSFAFSASYQLFHQSGKVGDTEICFRLQQHGRKLLPATSNPPKDDLRSPEHFWVYSASLARSSLRMWSGNCARYSRGWLGHSVRRHPRCRPVSWPFCKPSYTFCYCYFQLGVGIPHQLDIWLWPWSKTSSQSPDSVRQGAAPSVLPMHPNR